MSKSEKTPRIAGVATYDPRFIEVWERAATQDVELPVNSEKAGIALRHRLYRLRMAMHRELHPAYPSAAKCSIANPYKREAQWYLCISNADKQFQDALDKGGFDIPPPPPLLD